MKALNWSPPLSLAALAPGIAESCIGSPDHRYATSLLAQPVGHALEAVDILSRLLAPSIPSAVHLVGITHHH